MLEVARAEVEIILAVDPDLTLAENLHIKNFMQEQKHKTGWGKIA
jgi:hypothetical protein